MGHFDDPGFPLQLCTFADFCWSSGLLKEFMQAT